MRRRRKGSVVGLLIVALLTITACKEEEFESERIH